MSQARQVIMLTGGERGEFIGQEALSAAASAILPGHLIEVLSAGTVQEHSTAAANAAKTFALANTANGGTIDDAYAVGETVLFGTAQSGQLVNALLAAAAVAVTKGAPLESAGDGTLRVLTADAATDQTQRDSIVGYADESVDNSGGGAVARIAVRVA